RRYGSQNHKPLQHAPHAFSSLFTFFTFAHHHSFAVLKVLSVSVALQCIGAMYNTRVYRGHNKGTNPAVYVLIKLGTVYIMLASFKAMVRRANTVWVL